MSAYRDDVEAQSRIEIARASLRGAIARLPEAEREKAQRAALLLSEVQCAVENRIAWAEDATQPPAEQIRRQTEARRGR